MGKEGRTPTGWAKQLARVKAHNRLRNLRQKRRAPRARTVNLVRLPAVERVRLALLNPYPEGVVRPVTRADCKDAPRPCPFVSCRWHLYLDVTPIGNVKQNFEYGVEEMVQSCVLDVADAGGAQLEKVGAWMNLTRERIRQLEVVALKKLTRSRRLREYSLP